MFAYSLEDFLDYKELFYRLFNEFFCHITLAPIGLLNTCIIIIIIIIEKKINKSPSHIILR